MDLEQSWTLSPKETFSGGWNTNWGVEIDIAPPRAPLQHPLGTARKNEDIEGAIREVGKQRQLVFQNLGIWKSLVASPSATEITLWSLGGVRRAGHEDTEFTDLLAGEGEQRVAMECIRKCLSRANSGTHPASSGSDPAWKNEPAEQWT